MKTKRRVIALAFILGLLAWVVYVVGNYFSFDDWSFGELLILDVAPYQLYLGFFAIGLLLIFGLIICIALIERDQVQKALEERDDQYRSLTNDVLDTAAVGILVLDSDFRVVWVNEALERYFGLRRDEVVGKDKRQLIRERIKDIFEDPQLFADKVFCTYQHNTYIENFECHVLSGDGREERWLEHWSQPIRSGLYAGGRIEHYTDITEHKRAKEALHESHELFTSLVMSSQAGIMAYDLQGNITLCNPALERISGFPAKEVLGRTCLELFPFIDEVGEGDAIRQALKGEPATVSEIPFIIAQTGRSGYFDSSHFPVFDTQGRIVGGMGVIHDITERKQAEEALKEANIQLEQALSELEQVQAQIVSQERLHALGQMASGIAHDFNNILTPIMAFSEALLVRPESLNDREKVTEHLKKIYNAAKDAAEVVRRLHEFYRPRDEKDQVQAVDLNELIEESIAITQPMWQEQALASGISISVDRDLKAVPLVAASESELRHVFINLILNAVDAMPDGGTITFRSRVHDDTVVVEVSDTGVGMAPEVAQRCLEPFFSTKQKKGTGMGLALVYGSIQRHGGTLDIESEPGKGTIIRIHLPLRMAQTTTDSKPVREGPLSSLRVLLVENEPLVLEALAEHLTDDGHSIEMATNGLEGLDKFCMESFDVVLVDRAMPEMSGDQLALAVKEIAPDIPIIMMTGFGGLTTTNNEKPRAVDLVLGKPVTLTVLREGLAKAVQSKYRWGRGKEKTAARDRVDLRQLSKTEAS